MSSQCQKFVLYDAIFRSCHPERSEAKSKDLRLHITTARQLKNGAGRTVTSGLATIRPFAVFSVLFPARLEGSTGTMVSHRIGSQHPKGPHMAPKVIRAHINAAALAASPSQRPHPSPNSETTNRSAEPQKLAFQSNANVCACRTRSCTCKFPGSEAYRR